VGLDRSIGITDEAPLADRENVPTNSILTNDDANQGCEDPDGQRGYYEDLFKSLMEELSRNASAAVAS
jgi:hypothetical protein